MRTGAAEALAVGAGAVGGRAPGTDAVGARVATGRVVGAALLALVLLVAALPLALDLDPARQDLAATLAGPSAAYPLGTDHLGRDMLARLAHGARLSLALALLCVGAAALGGTALALAAAWFGGWVDRALSLVADAVLALPGLLLILLLAALAPGRPAYLALGIALTLGVELFRFARAHALESLAEPAVEASRLLGFGAVHALRRHVWPTLAPRLATLAAFGVATAVATLATLGFIGAGFAPPTPEWGTMTSELLPYWREAPWLILQPVIAMTATIGACLLLAGAR